MSRIPNSAMPHTWAQKQVDERKSPHGSRALRIAALAGAAWLGLRLLRSRRGHA